MLGRVVESTAQAIPSSTIRLSIAEKIKDLLHCGGLYLPLMPDVADDSVAQTLLFLVQHSVDLIY